MRFLLLVLIAAACCAQEPLTVYDGEAVAKGGSWAAPEGASLVAATIKAASGANHLALAGTATSWWVGGGWNWCSWWGKGSDLSAFSKLSLQLYIAEGPVQELSITLTDVNKKAGGKVDLKAAGICDLATLSAGYREVVVPLDTLCAGIDRSAVWEIGIGAVAGAEKGSLKVYIDDIRFLP